MIEIKRVSKRDWKTETGSNLYTQLGYHIGNGDNHIVVVPYGASTHTLLHELGHAKLGHQSNEAVTYNQLIQKEIDAEVWAWCAAGKPLTFMVCCVAISDLLYYRVVGANWVFQSVLNGLRAYNIEPSKCERSILWWMIRDNDNAIIADERANHTPLP